MSQENLAAATENIFGYVDDNDESLVSKAGGKFGLNIKAHFSKLEYNPNGGANNTPSPCADIEITIGDRRYSQRLYNADKVYKSNEQIDSTHPDYKAIYNVEMKQRMAVVTHAIKSLGVTDDNIKLAMQSNRPTDFVSWVNAMMTLVPVNFTTIPVDVFLEYQSQTSGDNDKTYLQLPKNMKGGRFLCPHVAPIGEWKKVSRADDGTMSDYNPEKGLFYTDAAGTEHVFNRNANFLASTKAFQSDEEGNALDGNGAGATATPGIPAASASAGKTMQWGV